MISIGAFFKSSHSLLQRERLSAKVTDNKSLRGIVGLAEGFSAGNHYLPSHYGGISVTAPAIVRVELFVVVAWTRNWETSLWWIGQDIAHRTVSGNRRTHVGSAHCHAFARSGGGLRHQPEGNHLRSLCILRCCLGEDERQPFVVWLNVSTMLRGSRDNGWAVYSPISGCSSK
jgi:hypothetical protein